MWSASANDATALRNAVPIFSMIAGDGIGQRIGIYLNGYVPNLQVGGQVVSFMTQHLDQPLWVARPVASVIAEAKWQA